MPSPTYTQSTSAAAESQSTGERHDKEKHHADTSTTAGLEDTDTDTGTIAPLSLTTTSSTAVLPTTTTDSSETLTSTTGAGALDVPTATTTRDSSLTTATITNTNTTTSTSTTASNIDLEQGSRRRNGPSDATVLALSKGLTQTELLLIMVALCCALFIAALDLSIVATAIPSMAAELAAPTGYTWIGSAFLLAYTATAPSWGNFSDIWGRKPMLLAAVAIFFLGSLVCGFSVSMAMLIAGRAVQGVGAGGIMSLVNICVGDLFSVRKRGVYYGLLGVVWATASAIGPVVGGIFTEKLSWRWCFWVNLPICALVFVILVFMLKLYNPRTPLRDGLRAVDWLGTVLVISGTLMILFGLEVGGIIYPWASAAPISLLCLGVATIGVFFYVEAKVAEKPVIPLRLFRKRTRLVGYAVCFCHGFCAISGPYYLPLYFQAVLGLSSLESGLYLLPFVLTTALVSIFTGIIIKKTGKYLPPTILGLFSITLGFGLFIDLGAQANLGKVILYQMLAGFGNGPLIQAPLIAIQASIHARDLAVATSTFGFIRQLSSSIAIVVGVVVFQNSMQQQHPMLLEKLGPALANQLSGSSAGGSVELVASLQGDTGEVARGAYWVSLRTMYIVYTAVAGLGLVISPLLGSMELSKVHQEHKTGLKAQGGDSDQGSESDRSSETDRSD